MCDPLTHFPLPLTGAAKCRGPCRGQLWGRCPQRLRTLPPAHYRACYTSFPPLAKTSCRKLVVRFPIETRQKAAGLSIGLRSRAVTVVTMMTVILAVRPLCKISSQSSTSSRRFGRKCELHTPPGARAFALNADAVFTPQTICIDIEPTSQNIGLDVEAIQ